MRGGGNSFEGCREKARPQVVACVTAALNAANGRANVAVAVPAEAAPKPLPGTALPAGFVAPPRTISDITAILDSEKPDPAVIEKSKATANAVPTGKESRAELSQFYFDRSTARSQLGRLADAIEDEKPRGIVHADAAGGDAAVLQNLGHALKRALVFLPDADIGADLNQFPGTHFLEAGQDVGGVAFGGNDYQERALAFSPADAGKKSHCGSGLQDHGAQSELLHGLLGLHDARLKIV